MNLWSIQAVLGAANRNIRCSRKEDSTFSSWGFSFTFIYLSLRQATDVGNIVFKILFQFLNMFLSYFCPGLSLLLWKPCVKLIQGVSKACMSTTFKPTGSKKNSDFPNIFSFQQQQQHTAFAWLLLLQVTSIRAVRQEVGDSTRQTEQPVSQFAGWLTVRKGSAQPQSCWLNHLTTALFPYGKEEEQVSLSLQTDTQVIV